MAARTAYKCAAKNSFGITRGTIVAVILSCILTYQVLQFWALNGIMDFGSAIALTDMVTWTFDVSNGVYDIGINGDAVKILTPTATVNVSRAFIARLFAYVLIVPAFLTAKVAWYYYSQPAVIKRGQCPRKTKRLFSLDWFTSGILMTALPLAVQNIAQFLVPMAIVVVFLFGNEYLTSEETEDFLDIAGLTLAVVAFVWLSFAGTLAASTPVPLPADVHPLLAYKLPDEAVRGAMAMFNSLILGPVLVVVTGLAFNAGQGNEVVYDTPGLQKTLQKPEPHRVVIASAGLGTLVFLLIKGAVTGTFIIVPSMF